jgi:DnaA family protein
MRQQPLPLVPAPAPSFESFLPGENASALQELRAFASAVATADRPGLAPVYLWGASGTGKTHLLRALQRQVQAADLAVVVFCQGQLSPLAAGGWQSGWQLVVLDGCENLDAAAQHTAFTLFVEAVARGVPVAAAGRLPPVDLPLREDLKTRLGWGHVWALRPAGDAEALAVLRAQAQARCMPVPDEVLHYMLTRCERDLGYLMRLLQALDDQALSLGRHVTVPLLRSLLADAAWARPTPPTAADGPPPNP